MSSSENSFQEPDDTYESLLKDIQNARNKLNSSNKVGKMSESELDNGNTSGGVNDDTQGPRHEVNLAKLQSPMPAFYALNVRLWLKQVDAHFQIHGLKSDNTKFNLLHVQLRPEILTQLADVIENPPEKDRYATLKERLIAAFSDSEQKRLKTLLSGIELGDRKPSILYNEMR